MIEVKDLSFRYGDLKALDSISFSLPENTIMALVGHNGAGKTTLFKCMSGLQKPFSGQILINNKDISSNPMALKKHIGFLQDFIGVYEDITVRQCLQYYGMAYKMGPKEISNRILWLADVLELKSFMDKKSGTLSRGMRQRLAIAQSMIHSPKILLLDEPASGLDPQSRNNLAILFKRLKSEGITLLVSSHILSELEAYADDMLILNKGALLERKISQSVAIRELHLRSSDSQKLWDLLKENLGLEPEVVNADEGVLKIKGEWDDQSQSELLTKIIDSNIPIQEFYQYKRGIQEDYLIRVQGENS
jgi:ABC-2 type transport system ATP-binding protein